jgi:hypothetical protein
MIIRLACVLGMTLPAVLCTGCDKPQPRALYTVNWYRTHEAERKVRVEECRAKPDLANTPDCRNATKAEELGTTR